MKILFITANRLGDAVLSTGLLAWLADHHPHARISVACGPYAAGLFRATPGLERVHVLRKLSWNRHWIGLWRACRSEDWDLIIDLRDSLVSRILHSQRRCYRKRHTRLHKVVENATALDLSIAPSPKIWLDQAALTAAKKVLPMTRPFLALGPAANWACKQWPIERYAALAAQLTAANGPLPEAPVLVIADARERTQIEPLLQSIPAERRIEMIGSELLTVAACLKEARLFIGNDSGLMHLAAAVGTPTLGLFGPGQEEIYGPWGAHCAYVRTPESREELLGRLPSPAAQEPNLMQGLSVQAVRDAAAFLLKQTVSLSETG